MSRRWTLDQLRRRVLFELDGQGWRTATELGRWLDLDHGRQHLQLCVVLERLVVDGEAEIQRPGSHVRRFRRRST